MKTIKKLLFLYISISMLFVACKMNDLNVDNLKFTKNGFDFEFNTDEITITTEEDFEISYTIGIPTRVVVSKGESRDVIDLSWQHVRFQGKQARYFIYISIDGENFERENLEAQVANTFRLNTQQAGIAAGVSVYFTIRAYFPEFELAGDLSEIVRGYTIGKPNWFNASLRESFDEVILTWDAVENSAFYTLERATVETGEKAPTAARAYERIAVPIPASAIGEDGRFVYKDKSIENGGDLTANNDYWYRLYAHKSHDVKSIASVPSLGAILAIGVPGAPEVLDVSKGVFDTAIRVMWKGTEGENNYVISRVTEDDLLAGNINGASINLQAGDVAAVASGTYVFYDTQSRVNLINGQSFYYRIAAKNEMGVGRMSEFNESDAVAKEFYRGYAFEKFQDRAINVGVTQKGFAVSWDAVEAAKAYYVYRFIPATKGDKPSGDLDWEYIATATKNSYLDEGHKTGLFNLMQDEVFYRVFAVGGDGENYFVEHSDYSYDFKDASLVYYSDEKIDLDYSDLQDELTNFALGATSIGHSGMSAYDSDYTVPVPKIVGTPIATQKDASIKGQIRVTGKIDDTSGLDKLNLKLVRTCRYGDEDGVYPLAEPRKAIGGVSFTKRGLPHVEAVEVFDLKEYLDISSGEFYFMDPMQDYRNGVAIPGSKVEWNYATWDREAWKDIKRQKAFDMKRAVEVDYQVVIERKSDPAWGTEKSTIFKGWAHITDIEYAHLSNWLKDVTLNRLSVIMVPRYAWNKTLAWLMSSNQSVAGENSPNSKAYISTWAQGLGGAGSGGVQAGYSDWPGFTFKTDQEISMSVSLDVGVRRQVDFKYSFTTPLYSGSSEVRIYARDYNHHWGLWDAQGYFKVKDGSGREFQFSPDKLMPFYDAGWVGLYPEEGTSIRYGKVLGRKAYDAGGEEFPLSHDDTNNCTFTRINLKYRPVPVLADFSKEQYPVMYYNYIK